MEIRKRNLCFASVLLYLLLLKTAVPAAGSSPVLYAAVYTLSYMLPTLLIFRAFPKEHASYRPILYDFGLSSGIFVVMVFFSSAVSLIFVSETPTVRLTFYTFAVSGLLTPVLEEMFWRHGVFRVLSRFGFIPAALISSLLFAMLHSQTAPFAYALFSGIMFSYLYSITNSPVCGICLHVFNNTVSLISCEIPQIIWIAVFAAAAVWAVFLTISRIKGSRRPPCKIFEASADIFRIPHLYIVFIVFLIVRFSEM